MLRDEFFWNLLPKDPESYFKELGKDAIIVLDTNVLLNLYSYEEAVSGEILDFLRGFKGRLWIPYQVALEYTRNINSRLSSEIASAISEDNSRLSSEIAEAKRRLRSKGTG